ncbi:MAG: dockerin type I domain-containing protein, partial [Planctomycetota bacterium]
WRLYQWRLDDPSQWQAWVDGDGVITGPLTTIDAIFLHGDRDAIVYLDDVVVTSDSTPLGLPGDADGDARVDLLDFDALAQHFNAVTGLGPARGDFNGDGAVDLLDFDILAQNFGAPGSSPATIPQPTALAGVGMAGALVARRRG